MALLICFLKMRLIMQFLIFISHIFACWTSSSIFNSIRNLILNCVYYFFCDFSKKKKRKWLSDYPKWTRHFSLSPFFGRAFTVEMKDVYRSRTYINIYFFPFILFFFRSTRRKGNTGGKG